VIKFEDVVPGAIFEINYDPVREITERAYCLQFKILPTTDIHQHRNGQIEVHGTLVVHDPNGWNRTNVNHTLGKCDKLIFSPKNASNDLLIGCLKTSHDFQ
jgi:hypothetical protein